MNSARFGGLFLALLLPISFPIAPLGHLHVLSPLLLLRHEREWCGGLRKWVAQHGHRSRLRARATVSLRRMVAIEFGTCRSGRIGGAAGSITGGKVKCFELRAGRS